LENYEKTIKYIFDYFCGVLSTRATHSKQVRCPSKTCVIYQRTAGL